MNKQVCIFWLEYYISNVTSFSCYHNQRRIRSVPYRLRCYPFSPLSLVFFLLLQIIKKFVGRYLYIMLISYSLSGFSSS